MKKTIILSIIIGVSLNLWAQNSNLKRTVLFTLGQDEELSENKYFAVQQLNQNRFIGIIYDTLKKTKTFVFNGKRIATTNASFNFDYLNINEDKGYVLTYPQGEDLYCLNNRGFSHRYLQAWGFDGDNYERFWCSKIEDNRLNYYAYHNGDITEPFDDVSLKPKRYSPDGYNFITSAGSYDYYYKLAGRWYGHKDGKNKRVDFAESYHSDNGKYHVNINGNVSQGYNAVKDLNLTRKGDYTYSYRDGDKWDANINGNISHGYDELYLQMIESGNYAYRCKNNGKWNVNINGNVSPAYDEVKSLQLTESGNYAYAYKNNGKWYINIDGIASQSYQEIKDLQLVGNGNYAYIYNENGKWNVNVNGNISQSYNDIIDLQLTESGDYAYYFYHDKDKHYVINGKTTPAWNEIISLTLTENYGFSFQYIADDGRIYINENGKEIKTDFLGSNLKSQKIDLWITNNNNLEFYSTDKENSFYSNNQYNYVVIDGKRVGKSPALHGWYDFEKNAFIWNAVEDKELVLYEYKL